MRRFLIICLTIALLAMAAAVPWVAANERRISSFISPAPRASVAGETTLRVSVPGEAERVRFDLSRDGGRSWRALGMDQDAADGWTLRWSPGHMKGAALLRAVPAGGESFRHAVVPVRLSGAAAPSVSVWPKAFSPNGDGRKDATTLTVALPDPASVTVLLTDGERRAVRRWFREAQPAGTVTFLWDGLRAGRALPDGPYRFRVTATDAEGRTASASAPVRLDTTPPAAAWKGAYPDPVVWHRTAGFHFTLRDAARNLRGSLHLSSIGGHPIGRSSSRPLEAGAQSIVWRPATADGRPLASGTYVARLSLADDAGNIAWSAPRTWRVQHREPARVVERVPGAGRRVALTFDDCYEAAGWRAVLDALRRARAKATFFCPAQAVAAHGALARRTVREGHAIGAHGFDHARLDGRSTSFVRTRLVRDADEWFRRTGRTSAPLFRPPYGAYDARTLRVAAHTGHGSVIMWDVDTADWRRPPVATIVQRAVRGSRPGSIVLMHTLPGTARAVPAIVRGLRARGLEPVTIPALLAAG